MLRRWTFASILIGSLLIAQIGRADLRYFTYSYEPKTLPEGAVELEQWATLENGGLDEGLRAVWKLRTEFEFGLTDDLTTALYFNSKNEFEQSPDAEVNKAKFTGLSSEWKYRLSDPTADPIGALLYGEVGIDRHEYKLEAKLVLGKNVGDLVFAANSIFELEWETEAESGGAEFEIETESKLELKQTVGAIYRLGRVALGIEAQAETERQDDEFEDVKLLAGPVFNVSKGEWFLTTTFLHELTDDQNETQTRFILGVSL